MVLNSYKIFFEYLIIITEKIIILITIIYIYNTRPIPLKNIRITLPILHIKNTYIDFLLRDNSVLLMQKGINKSDMEYTNNCAT